MLWELMILLMITIFYAINDLYTQGTNIGRKTGKSTWSGKN